VHGEAGRDRVDPDAVRRHIERRAPGERHHARLGRRVVRLAGLRTPAKHRGVVDDRAPAALRDHLAQRRAGAPERAGQRHVEHPRPLVVGHLHDRTGATQPGIVDHHIQTSTVVDRGFDEPSHARLVGDVTRHREDPVAVRLGEAVAGLGEAALVVVADHDPGALLQAAPRGRRPDARAGRGGHHDGLPVQKPVATHRGSPNTRVAMMFRWISSEPP
jgi:hypothetical protein